MVKKIICFMIIGCMFLNACSGGTDSNNSTKQTKNDQINIGIVFDTFVVERWQRDCDVFVTSAQELGAQVNVQNANGDSGKQKEQIEYLIDEKMDVIVIVPIKADGMSDMIKKARDKGIKVICYDRLALNSNADLYVSFDNYEVGRLMGTALSASATGLEKAVMICGPKSDNNVSLVNKGFESVMTEKNITISGTYFVEGWNADKATDQVEKNMDVIKDADMIMCGNDNIAGSVINSLSSYQLAGKILVSGQDADLEACQRIVEDTQYMTVYKPVEKLAKEAAVAAVALAKNEPLTTKETISDGSHDIPYIKLTPISVTKVNMKSTIIDSGFHLGEDVYLNRPNLLENK